MRLLFSLLVIFAIFNAAFASTVGNVAQFLIGFGEGLEIDINPQAQACLNGVTTTFDEFQTAFQLIDSGFKSKSVVQVGTGIQDLGLAIKAIPADYQSCGITTLVSDIDAIADKLSSGVDGIVDVILKEAVEIWEHKTDLSGEFKSAIADWKSGDFTDCGENVGKIVGLLLQD